MDTFTCIDCKQTKNVQKDGGTGYATLPTTNDKVCYACVAIRDRQTMIDKGHSRNLPLYLSPAQLHRVVGENPQKVANWPDTLSFPVFHCRVGSHNMAGKRYDVWFNGPDGFVWHGTQFGEWTQIVHCKRTKEKVINP